MGWNAEPPRSIGASPPAAALTQEASRNSWLVATSSIARVLIRSGSQARTTPPNGTWSSSSSICSASTEANASMPSTVIPSAILPRISEAPGCLSASSFARARTPGVKSSSRHGGAQSPCGAWPELRWSATLKTRISSTVSPKNSIRSGCSSVGGNTSSSPPRTASSPRLVTISTRA